MSSDSLNLSNFVSQSKKDKRLAAKKKKAEALLKLFEMNYGTNTGSNDQPPAKRKCHKGNGDRPATNLVISSSPNSLQSDEEFARVKLMTRDIQDKVAEVKAKKNLQKYGPTVAVTLKNMLPFDKFDDSEEGQRRLAEKLPPLFIVDVQHLLLLALLKNFSFWVPRWCRLSRPRKLSSVVLVVLKDVSFTDFEHYSECFPCLGNSFSKCVEIVNPAQYNSTVQHDVCSVPLSISQIKMYTKREDVRQRILRLITKPTRTKDAGNESINPTPTEDCVLDEESELDSAVRHRKDLEVEVDNDIKTIADVDKLPSEDEFPRTSLLLSTVQMMEEGYPLPVETNNKRYSSDRGYVFTKEQYAPVTVVSPMFAVDCEMVHTGLGNVELARVSVVNEKREVVFDKLVKPYNKITNYLTPFSGMTKELLDPVTTRLEDVQRELQTVLPSDAILCGQSLWNDLTVLKLYHPYVIDTAIIFNQSGEKKIRMGLRKLAQNYLGYTIQSSKNGHCSTEDARAVMDLVKLKLSKNLEYGDARLGGVYFPDIATYFQHPHKAQNVQETFSVPFPPNSSSTGVALHSHSGKLPVSELMSKTELPAEKNPCCLERGLSDSLSGIKKECVEDCKVIQCRMDAEPPSEPKTCVCLKCASSCASNDKSCKTFPGQDSSQHCSLQQRLGTSGSKDTTFGDVGSATDMEVEVRGISDSKDTTFGVVRSATDMEIEMKGTLQAPSGHTREEVFFKQEGCTVSFDFFEILSDNKISAGLIGSQQLASTFQRMPKLYCEVTKRDDTDEQVCAKVSLMNREKDFTWVELDTPAASSDDINAATAKKAAFLRVDEQVRKLINGLQERTLVAVLMSGRLLSGCHENAGTFLKITW